jgi:cytochrome bd-type quinol oxidase subunit 2
MDILMNILLALHIIGVASLLGGMLVQMKKMKTGETTILPAIMHGAWTMLVTGLIMVGIAEMQWKPGAEFHIWLAIKVVILLVIVVIALMNRKKAKLAGWVLPALMALTVLNIFVAVFRPTGS